MDELSPLFQEIEFHERYRGYDPDEVDAFVDRVARAAAAMRGRIAELHERVDAAEARTGGSGTHSDAEETLTRTLVLAQRTADAAIAEAREEADRLTADAATSAQAILSAAEAEAQLTLREAQAEASAGIKAAEERAGLVLAEAETDRRALVAEAESLASQAAAAERERLAAEVTELHEYRAFLADDIEILERHLGDQRRQLTASLTALTDLLESPEAFRASQAPATSGVAIDPQALAALAASEDESAASSGSRSEAESADGMVAAVEPPMEVEAEPAVETVAADAATVDAETVGSDSDPLPDSPVIDPAPATIDLVAAESAADVDEDPMIDESDADDLGGAPLAPADIDLVVPDGAPDFDPAPEPPGGEPAFAGMFESTFAEAPAVEAAPPRLVTAADLEHSMSPAGRLGSKTSTVDRRYDDAGPDTEAVPALIDGTLFAEPESDDDPFLSQLRDAMESEPLPEGDDDALSAFFDQDDDDGGRSWFGRRR